MDKKLPTLKDIYDKTGEYDYYFNSSKKFKLCYIENNNTILVTFEGWYITTIKNVIDYDETLGFVLKDNKDDTCWIKFVKSFNPFKE